MLLRAADDPDSITALRFIKVFALLWQNTISYDFMTEAVSSYSSVSTVENKEQRMTERTWKLHRTVY